MSEPPPDAYGRVTDPERYRVVWSAAQELVQDLHRRFDTQVDEAPRPADSLVAGQVSIEKVVRMIPTGNNVAPLVFEFTSFPGVYVRAGRWQRWAYPRCGCDACSEDPAATADRLRDDVEAVVAGRMIEESHDGSVRVNVTYAGGGGFSVGHVEAAGGQATAKGENRIEWRSWQERRP